MLDKPGRSEWISWICDFHKRSMGIEIKNLFQLPHIIKIPELILALIIVIIQRIGMIGSDLYPIDYLNFYLPTIEEASDPNFVETSFTIFAFGIFATYGFLFLTLMQIICLVMGEKSPIMVMIRPYQRMMNCLSK